MALCFNTKSQALAVQQEERMLHFSMSVSLQYFNRAGYNLKRSLAFPCEKSGLRAHSQGVREDSELCLLQ